MADTTENKTEDVEMADAAPADAEEEAPKKKAAAAAGKAPRFEIKKWNAVVSTMSLYWLHFCCIIYYAIFLLLKSESV
jgi:hypothetical protein